MASINFTDPKPAVTSPAPEFQFVIYNVAKAKNVGNIMRSAVAMGATTAVVIGSRKFQCFGAHNTDQFIKLNHFPDMDTAYKSLKERGFEVVGIEIGNNATNVLDSAQAFQGPTCFVFGEEGHGMSEHAKKYCDRFVYIPQYGCGTASLNVSNAAAIIFFQFATWAKYQESPVEGEKFVVDNDKNLAKPKFDEDGNILLTEDQMRKREERQLKRQKLAASETIDQQEVSLNDPTMIDTDTVATTENVDTEA